MLGDGSRPRAPWAALAAAARRPSKIPKVGGSDPAGDAGEGAPRDGGGDADVPPAVALEERPAAPLSPGVVKMDWSPRNKPTAIVPKAPLRQRS